MDKRKKMGRPRIGGEPGQENLTKKEIADRQRARLRAAGKSPFTYWIDDAVGEMVKKTAWAKGLTASELVEKILKEAGELDK